MNSSRSSLLLFGIPLLFLALATVLFRVFPWDLEWVKPFYDPGTDTWPLADRQPWGALYQFGFIPAWIVAIFGAVLFAVGYRANKLRRFRKVGLFLFLLLVFGPGLLVNGFKEFWERPRPSSTRPFGGDYAYEKVLTIDLTNPGDSFTSGHAAMGFYFIAFAFIFASFKKRGATIAAGLLALAYGGLMGTARVLQGGHFPSDIVWSAGFVFLTAAALYRLIGLHKGPFYAPPGKQ